MKTSTKIIGLMVTAGALIGLAGVAQAGYWNAVDVTLRDSTFDVVRSDGAATYSGSHDNSAIRDTSPDSTSDIRDAFVFEPVGKRYYTLQNPQIEGGAPILCNDSENRITFRSRENPDWYDLIQTLPPGVPVKLDAGVRCWSKGKGGIRYYLDYPSSEPNPGDQPECATATRRQDGAYVFEAGASCLADVYRFESVKGGYVAARSPTTCHSRSR
jgi:hypothetical protein